MSRDVQLSLRVVAENPVLAHVWFGNICHKEERWQEPGVQQMVLVRLQAAVALAGRASHHTVWEYFYSGR